MTVCGACSQAALHLYAMNAAVSMARDEMGPEKLSEVVEFHRRERLRELKEEAAAQAAEDGDWMASAMAMWSTPFMPNLLNTCAPPRPCARVRRAPATRRARVWTRGVIWPRATGRAERGV